MQHPRPLAHFLFRLIWLSVLPPVAVAAWLAVDHVLSLQETTRQQATHTARNFATSVDHFLTSRIKALNLLAVSPLVDDPQRWPELYIEALGFHDGFGSHVILADTGEPMRMLFNTSTPFGTALPPLPRPQGQAAAPSALATGKPAVGDTFRDPVTNQLLVAIAVPGIRNGTVMHLVLSILETSQLQQRLEQVALPAAWSLTLQDSKGDIIARRSTSNVNPLTDVDDEGRFIVGSIVSPWSVTLEIPRSVLHGPMITTGMTLAVLIVVASLTGIWGAILAGRRIGRQVTSLASPPAPDAPPVDIAEIAIARQLIDAAAASQRLHDSRYQATFEHASIGIAQVTLEGTFVQVNRAVCAMLGYSPEELRAMNWRQITPPDELATDLEYVRQLMTGDRVSFTREKQLQTRNGRLFWANLGVTLIRQPDGTPDYFIALVENIQARKEAEAALAESEQRYRQLVEHANIVILQWAPDGTILFFNKYAQNIFGWQTEEIVGQSVNLLVPERDSAGADQSGLVEAIAARPERFWQHTNENIRRDGSRLWIRWTNTAFYDDRGKITGILAIGSDITEHRQLIEELKLRNEELERFNQAAVGRELQMIELKRRINELSRQLGQAPPFDLSFVEVIP